MELEYHEEDDSDKRLSRINAAYRDLNYKGYGVIRAKYNVIVTAPCNIDGIEIITTFSTDPRRLSMFTISELEKCAKYFEPGKHSQATIPLEEYAKVY
ncbi:MAG: hypothetical protein FWE31_02760 [Firmicutes bacterium]|nr:hypothetical protein [Bacillota bacterium]